MKIKYSIVIPVYNTEKYIRKCLDSIKNQTYTNYEVIIINDGSTDNSLEIINEYTKDKKYKVYTTKNKGLSEARNNGVKHCTGDYILFIDSDDYIEPELLEKLSKLKDKYDVIRYKLKKVDEEKNIIDEDNIKANDKEISIKDLKDLQYFEMSQIYAFKRDFFVKNKFKFEPGKIHEDYGLIPLCLVKAKSMYSLNYFGYNYVQRKSEINESTNGTKRMENMIYHYNKLTNVIDKDKNISQNDKEEVKSILAVRMIYYLKYIPIKQLDKYIKLVKETDAINNIKDDKLKKILISKCPRIFSLLLKAKDKVTNFIKKELSLKLAIYLIINLIYMFIGSYKKKNYNIIPEVFSIGYHYLLAINVLIIGYLIFKKKYKYKKVDIFLYIAIILGVISTVFAYNVRMAIFGKNGRNEGLIMICYYITTVIIASFINKDKHKKMVIHTMFPFAIIQLIFGFIQVSGVYYNSSPLFVDKHQAAGFIANPNVFGTYMLINLTYAVGLYLDGKETKKQIIYIILMFLFSSGILIADALSCILAFVLILCALTVYLLFNKKFKKAFILIISFLLPLIILTKLNLTQAISDLIKTKEEVVEIGKGNIDDNFGTGRMYLWKRTLKIVPDHIWNGVGIDNFVYAFDGKALNGYIKKMGIYDKAHNEYLQILVTQGIFALICWLIIYLLIVKDGLIRFFKDKKTYLLIPVVGYLIQAFFNISVIEVAPMFYMALGLCINKDNAKLLK